MRKASQKREVEIRIVGQLQRRAEKHLECEKEELQLVRIADSDLIWKLSCHYENWIRNNFGR